MTDAEKKMKQYTRAVARRLNLPKDIRGRVMSDFVSSIQARREAGLTDEEIYAELGSPKKAAADLNEQMKEYTYRKSPWRFLFAACAACGGVVLFSELWSKLVLLIWLYRVERTMSPGEAASIGIIGGADGPTSVFITTPGWVHYLLPVLALTAGIWGYLRLRKCKRK